MKTNGSMIRLVVAIMLTGTTASLALAQRQASPTSPEDEPSTAAAIKDLRAQLAALQKEMAQLRKDLEKLAGQVGSEAGGTPPATPPAGADSTGASFWQDAIAVTRARITWLSSSPEQGLGAGRVAKRTVVLCAAPANAARLALHLPMGSSVGRFEAENTSGLCRIAYTWTSEFGMQETTVVGTAKIADGKVAWEVAEDATVPGRLLEDARRMESMLQYAALTIHGGEGDLLATYQFVPAKDIHVRLQGDPVSTSIGFPMGICQPVVRLDSESSWKTVSQRASRAEGLLLKGPAGETVLVKSTAGSDSVNLVFIPGASASPVLTAEQTRAIERIDRGLLRIWAMARSTEMEARSSPAATRTTRRVRFKTWPESVEPENVPGYLDLMGEEIRAVTADISPSTGVMALQARKDQAASRLPKTDDGEIAWDLERDSDYYRAFSDYRRVERDLQREKDRALGRELARFPEALAQYQEEVKKLLAEKQAVMAPSGRGSDTRIPVIVQAGSQGAVLARITVTMGEEEDTP